MILCQAVNSKIKGCETRKWSSGRYLGIITSLCRRKSCTVDAFRITQPSWNEESNSYLQLTSEYGLILINPYHRKEASDEQWSGYCEGARVMPCNKVVHSFGTHTTLHTHPQAGQP